MIGRAPAAAIVLAASLSACSGAAPVHVDGVYAYASKSLALRGTITFVQTDADVRVTDTTYVMADDRPLMGGGTLRGDRLEAVLVPKNGDTDYRADVSFVFSDGGRHFRLLGFSDTNGDSGGEDSYFGDRL